MNSAAASRQRVLIVGASGMGNVGDNMLAAVLTELCADSDAEAYLSGPDIDPLRVAAYDAVVVGGGGLVYAKRNGAVETQNLANYLKFGPICRKLKIPVALIGVGDQEQRNNEGERSGIFTDSLTSRFTAAALSAFALITTRDADSTALLARIGGAAIETGPDLLFLWADRARAAVKPSVIQPGRIALVGELYAHPAFVETFAESNGRLAADVQDGDFDILVMSDDDVAHAERIQRTLQGCGASAALIDVREHDFESLVFLFGAYSGVVTTRFHGLVLALLTNVPVVALDSQHGKCARLLRELAAETCLLLDTDEDGMERLAAALRGKLSPIPQDSVDKHAERSDVHRRALHRLLGLDCASETARATLRKHRPIGSPRPGADTPGLPDAGAIPLCWAASTPETKGYANLGDSLSAVMVAALTNRPVQHVGFEEPRTKLVAVGSIGHAIARGTAVIWGAGVSIRGGILARNVPRTRYDIRAVRGPISAGHYRDFGLAVPEIYGDPVWLLPSIVHEPVEPCYELGVIPHIRDVASVHPESAAKPDSLRYRVNATDASSVIVINTWHSPTWEGLLAKLRLIRSCKRIVSQSFHGLVIAEAFRIPALNFRALPGAKNGAVRLDLSEPCQTDPRVWEFFKGGRRPYFYTYSQRRDQETDWHDAIWAIDNLWEPFEYDVTPLVEAFPLPLAYDPLRERARELDVLSTLSF